MSDKDILNSRNREELIELAAHLMEADDELIWSLIRARKLAGFSQKDLADVMGVTQPTVAQFESQDNDPRLSTIRRYALAVGAEIQHRLTTCSGQEFETRSWTAIRVDTSVSYLTVDEANDTDQTYSVPQFTMVLAS